MLTSQIYKGTGSKVQFLSVLCNNSKNKQPLLILRVSSSQLALMLNIPTLLRYECE